MIIQSLCRYYDILESDESVTIARPGYSQAKVSFALVISGDGELTHIVDLRSDDKRPKPQMMDVPLQPSRANGISPYFTCDNAKYIFGVEKLKRSEFEKKRRTDSNDMAVLEENEKDVVVTLKRSRECFEAFKALHHEILDCLDDTGVKSFLKFLDTWKPEAFLGHPKIAEYKDEILGGGNMVFECGGTYLHTKSAVRQVWEIHAAHEEGDSTAQCLVSGRMEPIARLHQKIRGVDGSQMAGASLVSFNDQAFESYGKKQSFNAPVGESAMFKYTTALNYLLDRQNDNRIQLADTTTVFWAETREKACEDLANFLIDPREETADAADETAGSSARKDSATIQWVGDILRKVKSGQELQETDLRTDPETNFYVLGLAPNNARLAVRFWYADHFGNFVTRAARHHLDMEIVRDDSGPRYVSVYRLLKETVPKSSASKTVSPLLGGLVMRSILGGTPYPVQMYGAILNRVKVERSINYVRAGFIKAYLLRRARAGSLNLKEDQITMSLNEESPSVPYRLGRLFAVLEKAQNDTNREMKSTINSKYFSSASSTPAVVFPVLLKLAQHHIAKSEWGFRSSQMIEEILSGVDEFPAYLNLEEQGMFMLGYYHQRKAFFKKKEEVAPEEA